MASARINIHAIWNIFFRDPVCVSIVKNITSTHIAHGLNPSTNHNSAASIGSEYSRRLTTHINGRFTSSFLGSTTHGASAEHQSHHLCLVRDSVLFSKSELSVIVPAISCICFPVVSLHPNHSIISFPTRIIGVTFGRLFSVVNVW